MSKRHAALFEATYRFLRMMGTLKQNELLDTQRGEELDDLVVAARRTMAEIMDERSPLSRRGIRHREHAHLVQNLGPTFSLDVRRVERLVARRINPEVVLLLSFPNDDPGKKTAPGASPVPSSNS